MSRGYYENKKKKKGKIGRVPQSMKTSAMLCYVHQSKDFRRKIVKWYHRR